MGVGGGGWVGGGENMKNTKTRVIGFGRSR